MSAKQTVETKLAGLSKKKLEEGKSFLDTKMPSPEVDRDKIRSRAQSLTDAELHRMSDAAYQERPEYLARAAFIEELEAAVKTEHQQNELATNEAHREYDRLDDCVPVSVAEKLGFWGSLTNTVSSFNSYSLAGIAAAGAGISMFVGLEVFGCQLGSLTSSAETWVSDNITALAFCMAFTVSAIVSTRNYMHLRIRLEEDVDKLNRRLGKPSTLKWRVGKLKGGQEEGDAPDTLEIGAELILYKLTWANRFKNLAWAMLGAFCLFTTVLHVDHFDLIKTPLQALLMIGGPNLLAATCTYLEGRLEHHRNRIWKLQIRRNPAKKAMHPELAELGEVEAKIDAFKGLKKTIVGQMNTGQESWRVAHETARDELADNADSLDALHESERKVLAMKNQQEALEMEQRQRREKLRLLGLDAVLDSDSDNDDSDEGPTVAAKVG